MASFTPNQRMTSDEHASEERLMGPSVKEIRVFDGSKARKMESFKDMGKVVERGKIYDIGAMERMFPARVQKAAMVKELSVKNKTVHCVLELADENLKNAMEPEKYPLLHIGCLVVGVMPLGNDLPGEGVVTLTDGRRGGIGGKELMCFNFKMSEGLSAFSCFPNFCVCSEDVMNGFSLIMNVKLGGLDFKDKVHPIAINMMSVVRQLDNSMETKCLLRNNNKAMYQPLINAKFLDTTRLELKLEQPSMINEDLTMEQEEDQVMLKVREAIKKIQVNGTGSQKDRSDNAPRGLY
ncbi:movement protein [Arracacha virus V]|uniref:Movement protein n=1 Tax=Arracacha virus V TaxID=1972716 RepID=A0A1V0JB98_9VIRU|nr:movement protein [Arracacha virus V]ARD06100.1 movement protein [Arracacha virus V]